MKRLLVDSSYARARDIAALGSREKAAVAVYAPPPEDKENIKPALGKKRAREPEAVQEWRERMTSSEAAALMKRRGRIERVNAQSKNRGFGTMLVRGLKKVQAVGLLHALAHNLATAVRLRAECRAAPVAA